MQIRPLSMGIEDLKYYFAIKKDEFDLTNQVVGKKFKAFGKW